jgi:hypothetical protein
MASEYDDDFKLLSRDEMRIILNKMYTPWEKHVPPSIDLQFYRNKMTINDVFLLTKVYRMCLLDIVHGRPNVQDKHRQRKLSHKKHVILSRFLLKCECGMIKKVDGKIIYSDTPTKPIPLIRKIVMSAAGPTVRTFEQKQAPTAMPKFMEIFKREQTLPLPRQK